MKNNIDMYSVYGISSVVDTNGAVEDYYDLDIPKALVGKEKYHTLRKMSFNSTIASVLFLQRCLMMSASWRVKPATGQSENDEVVLLFRTIMDDMSQSWGTFMNKISMFLLYGWSAAEIVLKRRAPDNSRFPDGKVGIANLRVLPHSKFKRWEVNKSGDLVGMTQQGNIYTDFKDVTIPIEKLLIFNAFCDDDSPEGRSLFTGAYEDWVTYNISQSSLRTGMIRNLVGIPLISIPGEIFERAADPTTEEGRQARRIIEEYKNIGSKINKNDVSSFVIPSDGFRDNGVMNGTKQYDIKLLSLSGQSLVDVNSAQTQLRANMARVVIGDFLQIGTSGRTGSYSLGNTRQEMFARSINAINKNIADNVFNNKLIPLIGRLNLLDTTRLPTIEPEDVNPMDIKTIADALAQLQLAGSEIFPDEVALSQIRDKLGLRGDIRRPEGYVPPYLRDDGSYPSGNGTVSKITDDSQRR